MLCHFVVFVILLFKDFYPNKFVPLHLTRSNSYEFFFSKIGGMVGIERMYDFDELINRANTLNHLFAILYGLNDLQFYKIHNKMNNVWTELHPLAND